MPTELLGHGSDWWNGAMLLSLGFAALAAVFVVAATAGVIAVQRREAAASAEKIELLRNANLRLEASITPRSLTKEQFDAIQELRGKIAAVNVCSETDAKSYWFSQQVAIALQKAGIKVLGYERGPGVHSTANILYDEHAFTNPNGKPTAGEPLTSVLAKAGIMTGSLLARMPSDVHAPADIPMILIGGKFPVPPKPPYLGAANEAAKAVPTK